MAQHRTPANFRVEINGLPAGYFIHCEGLDSENAGAAGRTKWSNITLKKGYIATDPFSHKVNPATAAHKVNPAMHKVNPAMHKVNPGSVEHKVNPAMHKVNPVMHKVNPAMHKVNPGAAMHKANPAADLEMRSAGRLVLHGFVLDEANKHLLQPWVTAGSSTPTPQGHIVMLDELGRPVRRWQFFEAWPCKWYVPDLDGSSSVELAVSRLIRA